MVSYGGSPHNISLLVPSSYKTKTLQLLNKGLFGDLLLKLAHIPRPEYFAWIRVAVIIPVILYLVYYLSLGKKNYLKLQEDKNNIFN
jgi:hypothetical protein